MIEFGQDIDEVLHAAGQPVGRPDQDDIELVTTSVKEHLVEAGPAGPGAADAVVGVGLHHFKASLRSQLLEI